MLTHKAILGINLRNGDLRRTKPEWDKKKRKVITEWVRNKFYPLAKSLNLDIENVILAYTLSRKYVSFPIVGATNTEQVLINLKSDKIKLKEKTLKDIEDLYSDFEKYIIDNFGQEPYEFMGLKNKFYHPSGSELIKNQ